MLNKYSQTKAFALGIEITPMTKSLPSDLHNLEEETDRKISFKFKDILPEQWQCAGSSGTWWKSGAWEQSPALELTHPGISGAKVGDLIRDLVKRERLCPGIKHQKTNWKEGGSWLNTPTLLLTHPAVQIY